MVLFVEQPFLEMLGAHHTLVAAPGEPLPEVERSLQRVVVELQRCRCEANRHAIDPFLPHDPHLAVEDPCFLLGQSAPLQQIVVDFLTSFDLFRFF